MGSFQKENLFLQEDSYALVNSFSYINDAFNVNNKMMILLGGFDMDIIRVKQILSSSADVNVMYNGSSVWIDELHEEEGLVTCHLRGPFEERTQVAISDLMEVT